MIDEHSARVNGALVVALLAVAVLTPYRWVLALVVADFAIKVLAGFAHSPLCKVADATAQALKLTRKMTDSAPKRFAAIIGLLMATVGLLIAYLMPSADVAFYAVTGTFIVFASLESFAGFCMGCFLYGLLPEGAAAAFVRRARRA